MEQHIGLLKMAETMEFRYMGGFLFLVLRHSFRDWAFICGVDIETPMIILIGSGISEIIFIPEGIKERIWI